MSRAKLLALVVVCYVLVAAVRLTAPSDIDNRDQARQGLYVLDIMQRGTFFLPYERGGSKPATKPPLYNWAAATISLAWGEVTDLTIRLPSVLCGLGVVVLTFLIGQTLLSPRAGLLASLVLTLSLHFTTLSGIARTDMMLCFFMTLSLYAFLLAYRDRGRRAVYPLLLFVALGLGTITKGPVALLAFLVILVFLFLKKDLKVLRSMRLGWGIGIWLLIVLGWFVPALVQGGRDFFHIVIVDEMVNRVLAAGARAGKTRPFYYLVGHFFSKFLPWSLFVPSALLWFWKSKDKAQKARLLLPVVWFLTILVVFSLSRGKRADYILPLYPAAALIVAHFWLSVVEREDAGRWSRHLRALSLVYLVAALGMVAGLTLLLTAPGLVRGVMGSGATASEKVSLARHSLKARTALFLLISLPLAATAIAALAATVRRGLRALLPLLLPVAGLQLALYFHILSPRALSNSGAQKKAFCTRVSQRVDSLDALQFHHVRNSILFYLKRNVLPLNRAEARRFFRSSVRPYLITTGTDYLALRKGADSEVVILERSGHLIREEDEYILLGRKMAHTPVEEPR